MSEKRKPRECWLIVDPGGPWLSAWPTKEHAEHLSQGKGWVVVPMREVLEGEEGLRPRIQKARDLAGKIRAHTKDSFYMATELLDILDSVLNGEPKGDPPNALREGEEDIRSLARKLALSLNSWSSTDPDMRKATSNLLDRAEAAGLLGEG